MAEVFNLDKKQTRSQNICIQLYDPAFWIARLGFQGIFSPTPRIFFLQICTGISLPHWGSLLDDDISLVATLSPSMQIYIILRMLA